MENVVQPFRDNTLIDILMESVDHTLYTMGLTLQGEQQYHDQKTGIVEAPSHRPLKMFLYCALEVKPYSILTPSNIRTFHENMVTRDGFFETAQTFSNYFHSKLFMTSDLSYDDLLDKMLIVLLQNITEAREEFVLLPQVLQTQLNYTNGVYNFSMADWKHLLLSNRWLVPLILLPLITPIKNIELWLKRDEQNRIQDEIVV